MAHSYPLQLKWTGNTLDGTYNRNATATNPGKPGLAVSSAPEFAGDPHPLESRRSAGHGPGHLPHAHIPRPLRQGQGPGAGL